MLKTKECLHCNSSNANVVKTYKRNWLFCNDCGTGTPKQRSFYPLSFLPYNIFKKPKAQTESSIYDYFTDSSHIEYSKNEAKNFSKDILQRNNIEIADKTILDVSGGEGNFINEIKNMGAKSVTLTEINEKAIEYARENFDFDVVEYNFNTDSLTEKLTGKFDLIFLRAALMFCKDLDNLLKDLKKLLKKDGRIIVQYLVQPTLGTVLRVQYDEFSYHALYQPAVVVEKFENAKFKLVMQEDEVDQSMYIYDFDRILPLMYHKYLYEIPASRILRKNKNFNFIARDRRRSTLIFKT